MSAVIGPDGTVRDRSGALYSAAILVDTVPLRSATTLATRVGAWPEYVLTALALVGVAGVVWRNRRSRSLSKDAPPAEEAQEEMVTT
jgi:apolipoprotein N-acyltransferase